MAQCPDQASAIDWRDFWDGPLDRIALAPMEGVVDAPMRELITEIGGVDLCVTEFIRITDRLLPDSEFFKYCPELRAGCRTSTGVPVLVQLLGGQPGPMGENAARVAELGAPGIDLNFGCPAKTVNRHDGGAALLRDPRRIHDVVASVRQAVPQALPVSAKVRLGFDSKDLHLDIARAAESGGAAWLTVHARTRDEGYRPPAHWEYIARMREAVTIPVIANGEIWTIEDFARAREVSGSRHVMIGRGLMSAPDLARAIKALGTRMSSSAGSGFGTEETLRASWSEAAGWLARFALLSRDYRSEHYAVCRVKQWLRSLTRHYTDKQSLFDSVKRLDELSLILETIEASRTGAEIA